jgi:hypothetical protein
MSELDDEYFVSADNFPDVILDEDDDETGTPDGLEELCAQFNSRLADLYMPFDLCSEEDDEDENDEA